MTLRPIYTSGQPHGRFNVDPSATFQAGQVGMLSVDAAGLPIVTLAGTKPLGLIEDNKTAAFTQPIVGELLTIGVGAGSTAVLAHANVVADSELVFLLDAAGAPTAIVKPTDYTIVNTNGILTTVAAGAIAGAAPYIDADGDAVLDSVNLSVNYQFALPGVAGADTTLASGLVTLHFQRGEFSVGVYDTANPYAVNDKLYVGDGAVAPLGTLTSDGAGNPQVVGICTQPPTASNPLLSLITDFDYGTWT